MTLKKLTLNRNQKGFTLIELMIVIAIIGILAAIAIPNFIAYRNKSFCSGAESDANAVLAAVADYFAIPSNQTITAANLVLAGVGAQLSNKNTWVLNGNAEPIEVVVTDASGRCPQDYRDAMAKDKVGPRGYWLNLTYVKKMAME